jgi:hypothetical protein
MQPKLVHGIQVIPDSLMRAHDCSPNVRSAGRRINASAVGGSNLLVGLPKDAPRLDTR